MSHDCATSTDRELWRERPDDYYADSIHVTESGGIGINCSGTVYVMPLRQWHSQASSVQPHAPGETGPSGAAGPQPRDSQVVLPPETRDEDTEGAERAPKPE